MWQLGVPFAVATHNARHAPDVVPRSLSARYAGARVMPGVMPRSESLTDRAVGDGLVNLSSMSAVIMVTVEKLNHEHTRAQHEKTTLLCVVRVCVRG